MNFFKSCINYFRNVLSPSSEVVELAENRRRREILLVMLSLDTHGVECPSLWEICEKMKLTRKSMSVQELFAHCTVLSNAGYMQKIGDGRNPFFMLSDKGFKELGFSSK